MTSGTFIGCGSSSNMTKAMNSSSTQVNMFIKSTSIISNSTFLHIQDASGTDLLTVKPQNGAYYFLFSSPKLAKGASYSIYSGGSYNGGTSTNGYMTGGTYSPGTLRKTVTTLTLGTVNTISF